MRSLTQAHASGHRPDWIWVAVVAAVLLTAGGVALAGSLGQRGAQDGAVAKCRGERATIVGSAGVDRLVGTPRRDVIVAGAGGDVVLARGGNDVVCDREGADRVIGGRGDDEIGGGSGADRLAAGPGDDWLAGRRGADTMLGGRGNDQLHGERGNDALRGNAGDDMLGGGSGRDNCIGGAGTDVMVDCESGDAGSDTPPAAPGPPAQGQAPGAPAGTTPGQPPAPQNHAPTGIALSKATVDENEDAGTAVGTFSASDPDPGDMHVFALVPGAGSDDNGSFVIDGATLKTADTFDYETKSSYSIRVRATDFGTPAGQIVRTFTITVTDVDDAPTAVNDSATVAEDSAAGAIDVLANDTDTDGGAMTIASSSDPANGTVVLTGGSPGAHTGLTFEPDPNYCNSPPGTTPETFTYTLNGGSTATVSVTVTCAEDLPTAVDDSATVPEDSAATPLAVLANDTDPDGDPMTIASASDPANGTVVLTGGLPGAHTGLTYQPDPNYCSATPDTFTYMLNGGSTATVSVTVTCGDDAPTAVNDSATVAEDSAASAIDVLTNDTDSDGGAMTIASSSDPANGTVVLTGGSPGAHTGLTYQPDPNYCSATPDTFTYTLNGGSTATVSVTVTCVDDAPTAVDDSATVGEDAGASAIDVLANDTDTDGGPRSVASVTQPTNGTVVITGGGTGLTYQPAPNYCSATPDTFTYTLNGGDSATVSITVTCVDDPPTAVNDSTTVAEDAAATDVDVLANDTDVDGGPKSVSSVTQSTNGTVLITGGGTGLTYQPNPGYCNDSPGTPSDTFTYTLNGGSTATVSVTVSCNDNPPTAVDDSATVAEDSGASAIDVLANDTDTDGGPRSVASVTQPTNGTVVITGGGSGLTYQPNANYCSATPDTFTYTLNGGDSATVSVTVTCVDDAPTAVDDSATVVEDSGAAARDVLANDLNADGGPITIASASDPANGAVVVTGGGTGLTYQPDANYCGSDTFTYTLNGGSTATVSMTVTCAPDDPVVDTSAGSASYTENAAATVIDAAVTVSDPDAGTTITGATIQITGNYAGAQDVLALAGSHPGITATVSGDTLTLSGNASTAAYQAALRDVTYRNSSDAPSTADRTITFTVTDDTSRSGSDTKGLTVSAVNDPPTAVNDSATVLEDAAATAITVLTNDTDPDGGTKSIASVTQPTNGTVVITGGGTGLTYQPNPNYCNDPPGTTPSTFTYTLNGGSNATVSVTVTCVNDAPVADDETFNGNDSAHGNTTLQVDDPDDNKSAPTHPHTEITGDILAGDTDIDGPGPLTVTPGTFATNDGGSVTIESDGDFMFLPAASTSCTDTSDFFDYTVEDSGSPEQTDTGRVTVAIAGCVWYVSNNAAGNSGTSAAPFDTLAQAETASGNNHTVFVFDGDNTSTGYATGYQMNSGERLIGEHEGLVVDPDGGSALIADNLHPANLGARPTLTASNEDVIALDDGNELRGFNLDPSGSSRGIAGGTGDTGGSTIDDVNILDTGTAGSLPGLELSGTTGTHNITGFSYDNTGVPSSASAVSLANAGTVDFGSTSITKVGAKGLDAGTTNMGSSTFDSIVVTGSNSGGVNMASTTGTTALGDGSGTDLSLTTTGGAQAALALANAGSVSVPAGGTANLSATGGPALDVTGTSGASLAFDDVDSTNSIGDGINIDGLGTGTFSATSGDIGGYSGIGFDLNGGSGAITYPGNLNNGSGTTAVEITGRSGGAVTLSGPIADTNDAGGGISLAGNTGGSTTFSNASKVLNTATANAVSFTGSDGHTLTLSGGGLDVDTTTGQGFVATASGTINVSGAGNTVTSTTGRAVNVQSTDFGGGGFTFQAVSSNGAPNGILLNSTGTTAGMTITGTGAANSGGSIQNATEHGVSLTTTSNFNADELSITGANFAGVDGTDVTNFTFTDGEIVNAGDSRTNNLHGSIAFNDQAANENNIDGTLTITGNLLDEHYGGGVDVFNRSGTISNATVSNNTIDSAADEALSREDAISFNLFGSASTVASLTTAQIEDNVITDHPSGNGITILGAQTNTGGAPTPTIGQPGSATNRILIDGNLLTGDPINRFGGSAIQAGIEGRGVGNFDITNNGTVANPITNVGTHGIATGNSGSSEVEYLIQNNRVDANNFEGGGLGIRSASDQHIMVGGATLATPTLKTIIANNVVRNTTGGGIRVLAMNSNGTSEVKVTGNDIANGAAGAFPIRVENGSAADVAFDPTMCATISGNTTAANAPTPGGNTAPGIGLFKRSAVAANYQFGIVGLSPSPSTNANTETFVTGQNPASSLGGGFWAGKRVTVDAGDNFVSCTHPAGF